MYGARLDDTPIMYRLAGLLVVAFVICIILAKNPGGYTGMSAENHKVLTTMLGTDSYRVGTDNSLYVNGELVGEVHIDDDGLYITWAEGAAEKYASHMAG